MRVYAGIDPLSGKKHPLAEVVPAGPRAAKEAEKVRIRLQADVDERRNPRTKATVRELLERYLEVLMIEDTTRVGYERLVRLHFEPLLGGLSIGYHHRRHERRGAFGQLRYLCVRCKVDRRRVSSRSRPPIGSGAAGRWAHRYFRRPWINTSGGIGCGG